MEIRMKMGSDDRRKVEVRVEDPERAARGRFPLKLLILSEFASRDEWGAPTVEPRRMEVDKENFGEALKQLAGTVALKVSNRLGGPAKEWPVLLPLNGIKSFHPEAIVESVPALKDLMAVRERLVRLRDGALSDETFRGELAQLPGGADILGRIQTAIRSRPAEAPPREASPPVPERPPAGGERDGSLESLFEMVAVPGPAPAAGPASTSRLDHFISDVISSGRPGAPTDPRTIEPMIAELDAMLGLQVNAILHHPEFKRLEAVWRGVKFLVDRTDFREPIRIELLHAPKEKLGEIFEREVFQPESRGVAEAPVSVIIADYFFDRSRRDIELLQELAGKAERLQAPLVAAAGPAFFGMESIDELNQLDAPATLFDQTEYVKWRSFRQGSASRWLTVLLNRFLLRLPYGPDQNRVKRFAFREERSPLWGNAVWGLASLLTASFAKTGWCSEITGARGGGVIEDLPLWEIERGGEPGQSPLEAPISEEHRIDLAQSGLLALTVRLNSDAVVLPSAPSVHRAERYPDPRETALSAARAAFPYQLIAGRLSQVVGLVAGEIGEGKSPAVIETVFTEALASFLSVSAPGAIEVQVKEGEEQPERYDLFITFRPDRAGLAISAPVGLSLSLRK